MQEKKNFFSRFIRFYRGLPAKKQYVEFFTAILTVPVLLTVIILNVSNLRQEDKAKEKSPEPTPRIIITTLEPRSQAGSTDTSATSAKSTPTEACKKEIGPVDISSPLEGDTVTDNPLVISIERDGEGYCAVVWSYRINSGRWSEYDDKSIALYNPPKGQVTLELRVKSVVTGQEKLLTRKFKYDGVIDPSASSSGTLSN